MLIAGQSLGFVPFVGGSHGNLCLSGSIGRFGETLALSGLDGRFELSPDLTALPPPLPAEVLRGQTWRFQVWYRDSVPEPTSNLTDGLKLTFL